MISKVSVLIGSLVLLTGCAAMGPDYASCSSMKTIIGSYEGSTKMLIEDMNAKSASGSTSLTDVLNMATTLKGTAQAMSMISGSDKFNELRDSLDTSVLNFGNAYESVFNGADGNSIDFQGLFDQTSEAATALQEYCR